MVHSKLEAWSPRGAVTSECSMRIPRMPIRSRIRAWLVKQDMQGGKGSKMCTARSAKGDIIIRFDTKYSGIIIALPAPTVPKQSPIQELKSLLKSKTNST